MKKWQRALAMAFPILLKTTLRVSGLLYSLLLDILSDADCGGASQTASIPLHPHLCLSPSFPLIPSQSPACACSC